MNIYIAGSFSNSISKDHLNHMIELVKKRYSDSNLYIPMEYKVPGDFQKLDGTWNLPNYEWAKNVYESDRKHIDKADLVFALYTSHICSSGTTWEIGYACGKGIPVIAYIPQDSDVNMSLMVMNGFDKRITEDGMIIPITEEYLSQFNQK